MKIRSLSDGIVYDAIARVCVQFGVGAVLWITMLGQARSETWSKSYQVRVGAHGNKTEHSFLTVPEGYAITRMWTEDSSQFGSSYVNLSYYGKGFNFLRQEEVAESYRRLIDLFGKYKAYEYQGRLRDELDRWQRLFVGIKSSTATVEVVAHAEGNGDFIQPKGASIKGIAYVKARYIGTRAELNQKLAKWNKILALAQQNAQPKPNFLVAVANETSTVLRITVDGVRYEIAPGRRRTLSLKPGRSHPYSISTPAVASGTRGTFSGKSSYWLTREKGVYRFVGLGEESGSVVGRR